MAVPRSLLFDPRPACSIPTAMRRTMTTTTARLTRRRPKLDKVARQSRASALLRTPRLPTVETCPSPMCGCANTPAMPEGLAIDRTSPLNGVVAPFAKQVLVCTGRDDWASRIEDEKEEGFNLAADLKKRFGRGGQHRDPFHSVSILNSSFPMTPPRPGDTQHASAYLLPNFKYMHYVEPKHDHFNPVKAMIKGWLLPRTLHAAHDALGPSDRDDLMCDDSYRDFMRTDDVRDVLVLICGHGGRDARCGIMGPLLRDEFGVKLATMGVRVLTEPIRAEGSWAGTSRPREAARDTTTSARRDTTARIGLVSHVGGHKFAGNVIIYLPPSLRGPEGKPQPLAGRGIWYGRVEPRHVEGLIQETILGGRVVADLFRGGIDMYGRMLRI